MQTAPALRRFLLVTLTAFASTRPALAQDPATVGQWTPVIPWPDKAVSSTLLPTGKVLWYRGEGTNAQSYLWDPATGQLTSQPFNPNIFCSGLCSLPDGKVLVTGGRVSGSQGPKHSFIYDPFADTWTPGPIFRQGRYYPTNLELGNGNVLVFSGYDGSANVNEEVESYTPGASTFEYLVGANRFMGYFPRMHLLPSGKVFHVGKEAASETFDPATRTWAPVATSNFGSRSHGTSVLLPTGNFDKVMILGDDGETNTVETIDLSAPAPRWSYATPMRSARGDMNAFIMPDATVLVCGGVSGGPNYPVEVYDPVANTWTQLAPMHSERKYHSSGVLLPDGRVMVAGADGNHSVEVFSPPYLFRGARPVIDAAPASVQYGESFAVTSSQAANITSMVLIRIGAATHAQDMQQRYVPLTFTLGAANRLDVLAPSQPNIAPPGYYMLFILGADKIPSVAKFVRIGGTGGPPPPPTGNEAPRVEAGPNQVISLPATVTLAGSVLDDGLPASPGAVTTLWEMESTTGTGTASFDDPGSLTPTVSFTQPGSYVLKLSASDGELGGSDVVTITAQSNGCSGTRAYQSRVATGADDAEEKATGSVSLTSSDLEMVMDGTAQTVAMRFGNLTIPAGATITSASLQFKADESQNEATTLTICGVAADSATLFTTTSRGLSSRPKTAATVRWTPAPWVAGALGPDQKSPDLTDVIQEIVDRPGWKSRSLALLVTGTGHRTGVAFEGTPAAAPLLVVETACGTGPRNKKPVVDAGPDQTVTLPARADLLGSATDDGIPAVPGTLQVRWRQVGGQAFGDVIFGDENAAVTTVAFPASGVYVLRLEAFDGEIGVHDEITITVRQPGATEIFERRVSAGSDDAEEKPSGSVSLTSSDLELVNDGGLQTVGIRFTGINVPRNATISKAYVQFTVDEATTEATQVTICGQAADNAPTFTTARLNVSGRARTTRWVGWTIPAWSPVGAAGTAQRTEDLAPVIQEIVSRGNWTSGNALALLITGSGRRVAEAFEGGGTIAPLLHIEYGSTGGTDDHPTADDAGAIQALARLGPVFPNPGAATRTLHFELARATDVTLEIYDVRGALVRRVASGPHAPGHHAQWWDGRDRMGRRLPNGVYLVRLAAAGQHESRKLVICE